MIRPVHATGVDEERLDELVTAFLGAIASGVEPDRQALIDSAPDLVAELSAFFADHDRLTRFAHPLRAVALVADQAWTRSPGGDFGDYEILREIGRGGMGVVCEADQRGLNRRVALKLVLAGRFAAADDLRRFRIESEAAAQLDHPNIVPIFEVGEHGGLPFFSMKLLDGGSLADHLDAYRDDPDSAARLVAKIARAVHHAHQRGILHRDLKPSNILLDADGRPFVTDFGLAKRLESGEDSTMTGIVLGSPRYMAPEQIAGDKRAVTTATDVYGLGAILYAMLTGRPPFLGASVLETVERVKAGNLDPPSRVTRRVDRDLEAICLKCLEKDPDRRYPSALALADDLDRYLAGLPTLARPLSRLSRAHRWAGRHRRTLLATAAIVLILGLSGLGAWQAHHLRQARYLARGHEEVIRHRDQLARHGRYVIDVSMAAGLIRNGEAQPGESILERHRPAPGQEDLRGFEWYYLKGLVHQEQATLLGHEGREVYHVEFAPDGRTLASAGQDRTVHVWDVATRRLRTVLRGHSDEVNWVTYSPNSTLLATASDDGTVRLWDAATGQPRQEPLRGHTAAVVAVVFTPDGRWLISGGRDDHLRVWDVATGRERGTRNAVGWIESLAISPVGPWLATGGNASNLHLFDLRHAPALEELPLNDKDHIHHITRGVALAPDRRTLAATCERNIDLYDTVSRRLRSVLVGHGHAAQSLLFSPDGRTLTSAGDDATIRIWDPAAGSTRRILTGHSSRIWSVASSPDGRMLATASQDGTIKTWDLHRPRDRTVLELPDGHTAIVTSNEGLRIIHLDASGQVRTWNPMTGEAQVSPRQANLSGIRRDQSTLSPDGRFVAAWSDQRIRVADVRRGQILWDLPCAVYEVLCIFSPDQTRIAHSDGDSVRIRETATGREQLRLELGARAHVRAFLPGEELLVFHRTGGFNGEPILSIWNETSGRVRVSKGFSAQFVESFATVSPDGRVIAVGGNDHLIYLLDYQTLEERAVLRGHAATPNSLCFSPDGRTIATGGIDRAIRLWNVATGQELVSFDDPRAVVPGVAQFTPDGLTLVCRNRLQPGSDEFILWHAAAPDGDATDSMRRAGSPGSPPKDKEPSPRS